MNNINKLNYSVRIVANTFRYQNPKFVFYLKMRFKAKKSSFKNKNSSPFPVPLHQPENGTRQYTASFNGFSVNVLDQKSVEELHRNGCFGTGSDSHTTPIFLKNSLIDQSTKEPESLILFYEEAFFLHYCLKCLEIQDKDSNQMEPADIIRKFSNSKPDFISSFVAYRYLRSKNWVVKSGFKFAGDFLIYKRGPEFFHASYLVIIQKEGKDNSIKDMLQLQELIRVSQTAGKPIVIITVIPPRITMSIEDHLESNFEHFTVTESSPERFILK